MRAICPIVMDIDGRSGIGTVSSSSVDRVLRYKQVTLGTGSKLLIKKVERKSDGQCGRLRLCRKPLTKQLSLQTDVAVRLRTKSTVQKKGKNFLKTGLPLVKVSELLVHLLYATVEYQQFLCPVGRKISKALVQILPSFEQRKIRTKVHIKIKFRKKSFRGIPGEITLCMSVICTI